jgi:hypothetical protein
MPIRIIVPPIMPIDDLADSDLSTAVDRPPDDGRDEMDR